MQYHRQFVWKTQQTDGQTNRQTGSRTDRQTSRQERAPREQMNLIDTCHVTAIDFNYAGSGPGRRRKGGEGVEREVAR